MSAIIFNSKIVSSNDPCIKHNDRGFTLGHGLFETILVNKGSIPALDYHWRRLETSAPMIGISIPFSRIELHDQIRNVIIENHLDAKTAGVRVTITHGESERGILPMQSPEPNVVISAFERISPIKPDYSALIVNTRKNEWSISSRIKSLSYLDNIIAKKEAMDQGYDEAILLNTASNLADGAIANVFIVKGKQIITPLIADGALPGVIRSILLEEFKQQHPIIERSISPEELLNADEVFMTNALLGVKSVTKLNTRTFDSFTVAKSVREALRCSKSYI